MTKREIRLSDKNKESKVAKREARLRDAWQKGEEEKETEVTMTEAKKAVQEDTNLGNQRQNEGEMKLY